MAKISVKGAAGFHHHYPRVAAIVTCHVQGKDNAMTAAWHSPISANPPLFGIAIAPRRLTYQIILEAGEFGVNFLPIEAAELIAAVGGSSGKVMDKFERFKVAREQPPETAIPILKDAYAAYECKLVDHHTYGDHEWVVGEITASYFENDALTASGVLDLGQVNPALFLGAELYATTDKASLRHLERRVYGQR